MPRIEGNDKGQSSTIENDRPTVIKGTTTNLQPRLNLRVVNPVYTPDMSTSENREDRRNRTRTTITGTGGTANTNLKAAARNAWIFVGRLDQDTTADDITQFLLGNEISKVIECTEITTRGTNKAYKIGIPFEEKEKVYEPSIWPEGVLIRPYRFR